MTLTSVGFLLACLTISCQRFEATDFFERVNMKKFVSMVIISPINFV